MGHTPAAQLGKRLIRAFASDELHVQYRRNDGHYTLARTKDGATWETQDMPDGWFRAYAWTDAAFAAVAAAPCA